MMNEVVMRLYVGNLAKNVIQEDLQKAFEVFGTITSVTIITDRGNGVSKGFAFVEMPVDTEAKSAIAGLHGTDMKGRSMDVNEAKPRVERSGGRRNNRSFGGGRRSF
jgi:RNA recognition motif-containing protein